MLVEVRCHRHETFGERRRKKETVVAMLVEVAPPFAEVTVTRRLLEKEEERTNERTNERTDG